MKIEQALEELKKYAQDFAEVGDAKLAIKNNKDEFIHKWVKVMQYYKYVMNNAKSFDEMGMAINIVGDIEFDNPSLEEWVEMLIAPKQEKTQEQSLSKDIVDPATITGPIESLILEVKNMQDWDSDYIGDIEWQLQTYRNKLISNSNLFESSVFQSLIDDIDDSLAKITKFNKMINSDLMEDIKIM